MVKGQSIEIKTLAFSVMQNQIQSIKQFKPKQMPLMFRLLNKSIEKGQINNWQYISNVIISYRLLKKYREID